MSKEKEKSCRECVYFREADTYMEYTVPPYCVKKEIDLPERPVACEQYKSASED